MAWTSIPSTVYDIGKPITSISYGYLKENIEVHDHVAGRGAAISAGAISGLLGARVSKTFGTTYQAATDGFVEAWDTLGIGEEIQGITDSNATPTFIAQYGASPTRDSVSFFVIKGDYYKVTTTGSSSGNMRFIPLGS